LWQKTRVFLPADRNYYYYHCTHIYIYYICSTTTTTKTRVFLPADRKCDNNDDAEQQKQSLVELGIQDNNIRIHPDGHNVQEEGKEEAGVANYGGGMVKLLKDRIR
jgi:hypothetical protein